MNAFIRIGTLALFLIGTFTQLSAQTLGTAKALEFEPKNKCSYYELPFTSGDLVLRVGILSKPEKGKKQTALLVYDPETGNSEEHLITAPDVPGKELFGIPSISFSGYQWAIVEAWDKETGHVDIYMQAYTKQMVPKDEPIKIGTVALDPKSYDGSILSIRRCISPDGTKMLLYFDGIQSGNIKLAMCWAMDEQMELLWNGTYRLPVQSYGAKTKVDFFDDASVSVTVDAVELDEKNTTETSDGDIKAKVDKTYANKTTTSLYVMRDELFAKVDAEMLGVDKMTSGKLMHTDAGWSFAAFVLDVKGRNSETAWVVGTLGPDGATIVERHPVEILYGNQVLLDNMGAFFVSYSSKQNTELHVIKVDPTGTILWEHTAPYRTWPKFEVMNGRLIENLSLSKNSLEKIRNNEEPNSDANVMVLLQVMVSWYEGKRTILCLVPEDVGYKDGSMGIGPNAINKQGFAGVGYRQKGPAFTFVPITW